MADSDKLSPPSSRLKEAAAEVGAEALVGVVDGREPEGLGSRGSELSLRPDDDDSSVGRQEAEAGGDDPLRLEADGGLARLQGTDGGGELPVDGADTELRSSRSVTDTDSSPGSRPFICSAVGET